MFDSRHIQTFAEVVRTGSYAATARDLGYTQPAISQQMKALERAAGTPLFVRAGRGLRLTDAGQLLARHATGILSSIETAHGQLKAITRLESGRIRVCAFPAANATLLPATVARVAAAHPGIRVELLEEEPPDSLRALREGRCDLTLAFSPGNAGEHGSEEGLVELPLLDDPLMALLPVGHALAGNGRVELVQLERERWIAGCRRCRGHLVAACAAAGFAPDIAFTTDDNLAVQELVAAGAGVALVPGMTLPLLRHTDVVALPLAPAGGRRVSAFVLEGHETAPVTALLLRTLSETAA
ncbi:LysR family transcriptional regulator [Streptomyces endophyticus]|uniref:LysR family transcriptional regulator n=1 Tax=Streptomyces endophyticus TaxID=714166 RepID=A0ABU6FBR6_9ACTN|nr:LysR family transcriptional regulator [Streptomyces endophyticus]MEB8341481.1 LysR family transcriptional regulator [Streptomyces endophyticus]